MFAVAELANTMKINFSLFSEDSEEPHPLHFASPLLFSIQGDYFERASIGNIANFNG